MNCVALSLPCLARRRQHRALASAGKSDDSRDPLRPGDMFDRAALLIRQPRRRIAPGTCPDGYVLLFKRSIDIMTINAMAPRMFHNLRAVGHGAFDLDHFAGRISRKRDLACLGVRPLPLQLHQRRRGHDGRKGVLERLWVIIDVTMQRARYVVPIKHALFVRDDRKILFRRLPDPIRIAQHSLRIKPGARHDQAAPLHLRCMHAHMLGRLKLKPAFRMRTMVNPHIEAGHRQMLVRMLLPRLPDIAELHLRGRQPLIQQANILPLDMRFLAKPFLCDLARRHQKVRMMVPNVTRRMRRMDREIDRPTIAVRQILREGPRQL